jgi:hypothetical protein
MRWRSAQTQRLRIGLAALAWVAAACDPEGTARFEAAVTGGGCYAAQFPFEPTFFAAVETPTGALLRMEQHVRERTRTDGFYLMIDPARDGKPGLNGQPLSCSSMDDIHAGGSFRVEPEGCLQAYFRFNYSCQRDYVNLQVRGDVTFERFSLAAGQTVRGALTGELVELRAAPGVEARRVELTPRGPVSGTFAFEVTSSPSRQIFQWPPEHIMQP